MTIGLANTEGFFDIDDSKALGIIQTLRDKTRDRKIAWESTADGETVIANVGDSIDVEVFVFEGEGPQTNYTIQLSDGFPLVEYREYGHGMLRELFSEALMQTHAPEELERRVDETVKVLQSL